MGGSNWIPWGLGTNSLNRYIQCLLRFPFTSLACKYSTPRNPYESLIHKAMAVRRKQCLKVTYIHYFLKK